MKPNGVMFLVGKDIFLSLREEGEFQTAIQLRSVPKPLKGLKVDQLRVAKVRELVGGGYHIQPLYDIVLTKDGDTTTAHKFIVEQGGKKLSLMIDKSYVE